MSIDTTDPDLRFASPVTPGSPALERLIERIAPGAAERDHRRSHPFTEIELIRRARLGALRLPVAEGGGGATVSELFDVVLQLGEADPNIAHILRNHFGFVEGRLLAGRGGPPDVWLRKVLDGKIFGSAYTELGRAHAGPRDYAFATTITPDADGYRLEGTKYYSTGSYYSDWITVRGVGPDGVGASAIVPTDRDGVNLIDDWDGIGQRLTGTGTTEFHNVRVEHDEASFDPPAGAGGGIPYLATFPQLYLTTVIAGILRNVAADAVALVNRRPRTYYHAPTDRAADDPILQQTVGEIASNAFAAETLVRAAAGALDVATRSAVDGVRDLGLSLDASLQTAQAKVVIDQLATRTATLLFDVGGASATKRSAHLDRHWRNIRTLASHNPRTLKARAIGDHLVNGVPLPTGSYF